MTDNASCRVLILFNEPMLPADHPDADSEHEVIFTVENVERVLKADGYTVSRLGVHIDPAVLVTGLRDAKPDLVFNLFEGLPDHGETEAYVAGVLEWLGLTYTGCPPVAMTVARSKPLTKLLLRGAGLPTAESIAVEALPLGPCPLAFPLFVKPSNQDASVGIDQGSVVTSQEALEARVQALFERYGGPIMVEQYIPGREITITVIESPEPRALPVCEMLFESKDPNAWPIMTYNAKWKVGTDDYEANPIIYGCELPPGVGDELTRLALHAFRLLGCRDYARIDFRLDPSNRPYILEVNPNPDISPIAGVVGCLELARLTWTQFVLQIAENARRRGPRKPLVPACDKLIPW